jgi:hypothetical protein
VARFRSGDTAPARQTLGGSKWPSGSASPLRRSSHHPAAPPPSPAGALHFRSPSALQSFLCGTSSGLSGYPHPLLDLSVRAFTLSGWPLGSPRTTVPRATVKKRGSSSRGLHAPLVFHRATPAEVPQDFSTSHGVPLPIAASEDRIHSHGKLPRLPLRSALRVSHPLDGFRPDLPCGLISCRNHVRDSPFRGFPSRAAVPALRRAVPSCRCARLAYRSEDRRQLHTPRLQGFRHPGIRSSPARVLPRTGARSPPELHLPRVFSPFAMATVSRHLLP